MSAAPDARAKTLRDLALLAAGAAVLFGLWLGARDLWNPNEPTYGQAVAEMSQRGEWFVPTVNERIFGEKPILYFWLALGASRLLGGVDELTLRLPSAASGAAVVLLVYLLVRPYAGRRRARLSSVLLATTYIVFWSARSIQMDLLLTACTLGALLAATRVLDHGLSPARGWFLAGVAGGLALLAKGPVGLICPAVPLLLYAAATRRLRELARPAVSLAAAGALLVAAPWFVLLWARGETEFLVELLYRQNLQRFIDPWDHQRPWWYYLGHFWIDMLPWSPFLPLAWGLTPANESERRLFRLSWVWIVGLVVFFSLSQSKRSPYLLPAAPAVAVLVAAVGERWIEGRLSAGRRRTAVTLHVVLAFLFVAGAVYLAAVAGRYHLGHEGLIRATWATVALLTAGGLAIVVGASIRSRDRLAAPLAMFCLIVTLYLQAAVHTLPAADVFKSSRPMSLAIRDRIGSDRPIRGFHAWPWRASYSFYSGRSIPNLDSLEALRAYWRRPEQVFLVVERGELERAREVLGDASPLEARGAGHNFAYLFSNRPDGAGQTGGE